MSGVVRCSALFFAIKESADFAHFQRFDSVDGAIGETKRVLKDIMLCVDEGLLDERVGVWLMRVRLKVIVCERAGIGVLLHVLELVKH